MRGAAHVAISGVSAFATMAILNERHPAARLPHRAFAAVVAALASGLTDVLEPANTPHHRQFCHSLVFAGVMTSGMKKLYDWMPATPGEVLARDVLLSIGFGYMAHLCADATTAMGLPLVGKGLLKRGPIVLPTLELAARRKAQLYGYLEAVGQHLDPTETQYERARTSYEAVGAWLMGSDSLYLQEGSISPHGSIRIQTANRPFARAEFDVDLLDVLPGISERSNPAAVNALVGDRLKEKDQYRKILVEKNRCWQLQYKGEFHMDVTPAIRNPDCGNGGLLVPDKTLRV